VNNEFEKNLSLIEFEKIPECIQKLISTKIPLLAGDGSKCLQSQHSGGRGRRITSLLHGEFEGSLGYIVRPCLKATLLSSCHKHSILQLLPHFTEKTPVRLHTPNLFMKWQSRDFTSGLLDMIFMLFHYTSLSFYLELTLLLQLTMIKYKTFALNVHLQ
jgi:hypothetical protein